jgi:cytoskeletal protein CcmA (bactofilin family)
MEKGGTTVMNGGGNTQGSGKRTLIEEGTAVSGNIASTCPIVVMGRLEGEISGPSLEIAEGGAVSGRVKVAALCSRGELAGEVDAETVQLSGQVRDETIIRARSLEVGSPSGSPVRFGECELSIGDEPDKQRAIDEATGVARKDRSTLVAAPVPPEEEVPPEPPAPQAPPPDRRRRRSSGAVEIPLDPAESGRVAR